MAQRRMIQKKDYLLPCFWELTTHQRFLYHSILLFADDDGIIPVRLIHTQCFPYEKGWSENLLDDLKELEKYNFITLYSNDQFVLVTDWWDKQFIDKKIYKNTIFEKPPNYQPRPEDLKKYKAPILLEQKRVDKASKDKSSLEETNCGSMNVESSDESPLSSDEIPLPFD